MSLPYLQPYFGLGNSLQTAQAAAGGAGAAASGGWVELARTTLGSASNNIDVTSLADKRYLMVLGFLDGGDINTRITFNNDTGSNYSNRYNYNGGTDVLKTSVTDIRTDSSSVGKEFWVEYISNLSSKEKLWQAHMIKNSSSGAGNAPSRGEFPAKWTNTSSVISSIKHSDSAGATDIASGSEVVVLGWDPADTHTSNFWEELASVSGDGTSTTLDSGTITAKKYLWVQAYGSATTMDNMAFRFNSDTGSNYSRRLSLNGVEQTATSQTYLRLGSGSPTGGSLFGSGFIINNSANEKLLTSHWCRNRSTGAGTAPERFETVGKWANTSSQITSIQLIQSTSNNWDSDSMIKVWGSD